MHESRRPREFNVELSRTGARTLRGRLADAIRASIRDGTLRPGERLPSTRALAEQLGVSRGVTSDVFQELAVGGYIELRERAAAQVCAGGTALPGIAKADRDLQQPAAAVPPRYSFSLLAGDLSLFPRSDWLRCVQTVLRTVQDSELDYGDPLGHRALRVELSAYLRRARGVVADEDRLLITQGNTQALDIVFRVLAARGARRVALENPSYEGPWSAARRAGLETVALEVDDQGASPDALGVLAPDAVLLSPAHQFPLGHTLSPARRAAFARWALAGGGYLIEDDYDGELSYDRQPTLSLQGLAADRSIYVGTASKLLAPALRIGWLLLPAELVFECSELKLHSDRGSPLIDQLAFAELIRRGLLDRHLRRVRGAYRTRRDALADGLSARFPNATISGYASGSHLTMLLPTIADEADLLAAARKRDIALHTLGEFTFAPHPHGTAVVIGYARLGASALGHALDALAGAVHAAEIARLPAPSHPPRERGLSG